MSGCCISLRARGREAYDSDIAVVRACQFSVIRLAAHLERLGGDWLSDHPEVPVRLIKGCRPERLRQLRPVG